jgi:hypothetical protein
LLGIVAVSAAIPAYSDCPGVSHTDVTGSTWRTHSFEDPSTKVPLTVDLGVSEVGPGTTIEVFDGSSWSTVNGPTSVQGERIRINLSGSAHLSYVYDQCGEDVQFPEETS